MEYKVIELSVVDQVATITLNRPEVLNALSIAMLTELMGALDAVANDNDAEVLVLTGAGRGFCAGADLFDLQGLLAHDNAENGVSAGNSIANMMYVYHNRVSDCLGNFPKPVIASVNGVAAGGGLGLALAADIIVASDKASFVCVFGRQLGIVPDMGASYHLPRLVGKAVASRIALLGEKIDAQRAFEIGLVSEFVRADDLGSRVDEIAQQLALGSSRAFALTREGFLLSHSSTLSQQLAWEAEAQRELCDRDVFKKFLNRFLNR